MALQPPVSTVNVCVPTDQSLETKLRGDGLTSSPVEDPCVAHAHMSPRPIKACEHSEHTDLESLPIKAYWQSAHPDSVSLPYDTIPDLESNGMEKHNTVLQYGQQVADKMSVHVPVRGGPQPNPEIRHAPQVAGHMSVHTSVRSARFEDLSDVLTYQGAEDRIVDVEPNVVDDTVSSNPLLFKSDRTTNNRTTSVSVSFPNDIIPDLMSTKTQKQIPTPDHMASGQPPCIDQLRPPAAGCQQRCPHPDEILTNGCYSGVPCPSPMDKGLSPHASQSRPNAAECGGRQPNPDKGMIGKCHPGVVKLGPQAILELSLTSQGVGIVGQATGIAYSPQLRQQPGDGEQQPPELSHVMRSTTHQHDPTSDPVSGGSGSEERKHDHACFHQVNE